MLLDRRSEYRGINVLSKLADRIALDHPHVCEWDLKAGACFAPLTHSFSQCDDRVAVGEQLVLDHSQTLEVADLRPKYVLNDLRRPSVWGAILASVGPFWHFIPNYVWTQQA